MPSKFGKDRLKKKKNYMRSRASKVSLSIHFDNSLKISEIQNTAKVIKIKLSIENQNAFLNACKKRQQFLTLKVPITTGRRHFQSMFYVVFRGNNA